MPYIITYVTVKGSIGHTQSVKVKNFPRSIREVIVRILTTWRLTPQQITAAEAEYKKCKSFTAPDHTHRITGIEIHEIKEGKRVSALTNPLIILK